jgi:hypothetical protein
LTLSQQISAIQATDCESASKNRHFASAQKVAWLQLLDSVVQIVVNTAEVTDNGSDSKRFSEKVGLRMGDC